jgi:hypothetical protein
MRSAPRLVIIALLGLFLALPVTVAALPASAEPGDSLVVQPPSSSPSPSTSSPGASAPAGPKLQPDTEADKAESKKKLIMGGASVVLLVLVIWGRSIRRKRRKATEAPG